MNVFQRPDIGRLSFRLNVGHLSADHSAIGARGLRHHCNNGDAPLRVHRSESQRLKRERQQRVTRQDGDGLAKYFVIGGLAAPQIVIIERGQIVVDQRIRVYEFKRASDLHGAGGIFREHARSFQAQDRPDALASGENAVTHRAVNRKWRSRLDREQRFKRGLDCRVVLFESFGEFHAFVASDEKRFWEWPYNRPRLGRFVFRLERLRRDFSVRLLQ